MSKLEQKGQMLALLVLAQRTGELSDEDFAGYLMGLAMEIAPQIFISEQDGDDEIPGGATVN